MNGYSDCLYRGIKWVVMGGFLTMLTLWSAYSFGSTTTVHVAVNGDDENPGTAAQPERRR